MFNPLDSRQYPLAAQDTVGDFAKDNATNILTDFINAPIRVDFKLDHKTYNTLVSLTGHHFIQRDGTADRQISGDSSDDPNTHAPGNTHPILHGLSDLAEQTEFEHLRQRKDSLEVGPSPKNMPECDWATFLDPRTQARFVQASDSSDSAAQNTEMIRRGLGAQNRRRPCHILFGNMVIHDISFETMYKIFEATGALQGRFSCLIPSKLILGADFTDLETGMSWKFEEDKNRATMFLGDSTFSYIHKLSVLRQWRIQPVYNGSDFSLLFEVVRSYGPMQIFNVTRVVRGGSLSIRHVPGGTPMTRVLDVAVTLPFIKRWGNQLFQGLINQETFVKHLKGLKHYYIPTEIWNQASNYCDARSDKDINRQSAAAYMNAMCHQIFVSGHVIQKGLSLAPSDMNSIVIALLISSMVRRYVSTKAIGYMTKHIQRDYHWIYRVIGTIDWYLFNSQKGEGAIYGYGNLSSLTGMGRPMFLLLQVVDRMDSGTIDFESIIKDHGSAELINLPSRDTFIDIDPDDDGYCYHVCALAAYGLVCTLPPNPTVAQIQAYEANYNIKQPSPIVLANGHATVKLHASDVCQHLVARTLPDSREPPNTTIIRENWQDNLAKFRVCDDDGLNILKTEEVLDLLLTMTGRYNTVENLCALPLNDAPAWKDISVTHHVESNSTVLSSQKLITLPRGQKVKFDTNISCDRCIPHTDGIIVADFGQDAPTALQHIRNLRNLLKTPRGSYKIQDFFKVCATSQILTDLILTTAVVELEHANPWERFVMWGPHFPPGYYKSAPVAPSWKDKHLLKISKRLPWVRPPQKYFLKFHDWGSMLKFVYPPNFQGPSGGSSSSDSSYPYNPADYSSPDPRPKPSAPREPTPDGSSIVVLDSNRGSAEMPTRRNFTGSTFDPEEDDMLDIVIPPYLGEPTVADLADFDDDSAESEFNIESIPYPSVQETPEVVLTTPNPPETHSTADKQLAADVDTYSSIVSETLDFTLPPPNFPVPPPSHSSDTPCAPDAAPTNNSLPAEPLGATASNLPGIPVARPIKEFSLPRVEKQPAEPEDDYDEWERTAGHESKYSNSRLLDTNGFEDVDLDEDFGVPPELNANNFRVAVKSNAIDRTLSLMDYGRIFHACDGNCESPFIQDAPTLLSWIQDPASNICLTEGCVELLYEYCGRDSKHQLFRYVADNGFLLKVHVTTPLFHDAYHGVLYYVGNEIRGLPYPVSSPEPAEVTLDFGVFNVGAEIGRLLRSLQVGRSSPYYTVNEAAKTTVNAHPTLNRFCKAKIINGVPGCGKTKLMQKIFRSGDYQLVICPTSDLAEEYKVVNIKARTTISAIPYVDEKTSVIIDEAYKMGIIELVYILTHCKSALLVGDSQQTSFSSTYYNSRSPCPIKLLADATTSPVPRITVSRAVPLDVMVWVRNSDPAKKDYKTTNYRCRTVFMQNNANITKDAMVKQFEAYEVEGSRILCFSSKAHDLTRFQTVNAAQGYRNPVVGLYMSSNCSSTIHSVPQQLYVAMTRHTEKLIIFVQKDTAKTLMNVRPVHICPCSPGVPCQALEICSSTCQCLRPARKHFSYADIIGSRNHRSVYGPVAVANFDFADGPFGSSVSEDAEQRKTFTVPCEARTNMEVFGKIPIVGEDFQPGDDDAVLQDPDYEVVDVLIPPLRNVSMTAVDVVLQKVAPTSSDLFELRRQTGYTDLGQLGSKTLRINMKNRPILNPFSSITSKVTVPVTRCRSRAQTNELDHCIHSAVSRYGKDTTRIPRSQLDSKVSTLLNGLKKFVNISGLHLASPQMLATAQAEAVQNIVKKNDPGRQEEGLFGATSRSTNKISCFNKVQDKAGLKTETWLQGGTVNNSYVFKAGQPISASPKTINHIGAAWVRVLEMQIEKNLHRGVHLPNGNSTETFKGAIDRDLRDLPYQIYDTVCTDITEQDTTKTAATHEVVKVLLRMVGAPDSVIDALFCNLRGWAARGFDYTLSALDAFQSGSAMTYLNNTIDNMCRVGSAFNISEPFVAGFKGDDGFIRAESITPITTLRELKIERGVTGTFVGYLIGDELTLDLPRLANKAACRIYKDVHAAYQYATAVSDWLSVIKNDDQAQLMIRLNAAHYGLPVSDCEILWSFLVWYAQGNFARQFHARSGDHVAGYIYKKLVN